jgi:phosphoribosylformylglycinamidine synthase
MGRPRICIIQFPGVNCEYETAEALEQVGLEAAIFRWNRATDEIKDYHGFVLPGGFSYEDRLRAGAIAASEDIVGALADEARRGKPVLGICNGAQVLVEAGLVPGLERGRIDLALAPNKGMGRDGYYSDWVFVRESSGPGGSAITCAMEACEVFPIPVAHSQGRFTSSIEGLFEDLDRRGQLVLKYCSSDGGAPRGFPEDPNGSGGRAAAISNLSGNVVAMMPHPERCAWVRQVPGELPGKWSSKRREMRGRLDALEAEGPGSAVFRSLRTYIEDRV